jgi:phasin family protein
MAARRVGGTVTEPAELAQETGAAVAKGYDQTVSPLKDSMTGAVAGFEKTQAEVKANMEKAMRTAEEFMSFGQGNVEAVMRSGRIWAEGMQDLGKSFAATAQAQFDQTMSTFKALTGVKSLKEAIDLQATLARSSVETAVNETSRFTDASLKLAEQAFAPISQRMTLAAEKFGRAV